MTFSKSFVDSLLTIRETLPDQSKYLEARVEALSRENENLKRIIKSTEEELSSDDSPFDVESIH